MTIEWTLNVIPIKSLKEHPKNPRQIGKEQFDRLDKTINKFGLIDKPILNKDFTIIGGHQRIKILTKRKQVGVECWMPDRMLDEKEVEELMISLNLNQGQWDIDRLANEFEPVDLLEYGFSEKLLLDTYSNEKTEEATEEKKTAAKKKKECPSCGHNF